MKSNPGAPIGTSQNPIQLFQEGSTLRSLHPLTNTQVTQIAKALKEKTQTEIPSAVVCENGPNSTRCGAGNYHSIDFKNLNFFRSVIY
jgi:hypothetical protein